MLHCSLEKSKNASPRTSPLLQKLAIELLSFAEWSSMQLEVHPWSLAKGTAEQQRENPTNRTRRSWMNISILAKPLTIWCWAVLNFGASSMTASFVLVKAASMSTTRLFRTPEDVRRESHHAFKTNVPFFGFKCAFYYRYDRILQHIEKHTYMVTSCSDTVCRHARTL